MKHKNLVSTTGKFISQAMMPLSVVDDNSFRQIIHTADPRFSMPHRTCTYFSTKVIPVHYQYVRSVVEKELSKASDLWTAQHQNRSYISLTYMYIMSLIHLRRYQDVWKP